MPYLPSEAHTKGSCPAGLSAFCNARLSERHKIQIQVEEGENVGLFFFLFLFSLFLLFVSLCLSLRFRRFECSHAFFKHLLY